MSAFGTKQTFNPEIPFSMTDTKQAHNNPIVTTLINKEVNNG